MSEAQAVKTALTASVRIGDLLLKHTSLTQVQLDEALKIQKKEGGLLGEILVRKNMILPHEIMKALCQQIARYPCRAVPSLPMSPFFTMARRRWRRKP